MVYNVKIVNSSNISNDNYEDMQNLYMILHLSYKCFVQTAYFSGFYENTCATT